MYDYILDTQIMAVWIRSSKCKVWSGISAKDKADASQDTVSGPCLYGIKAVHKHRTVAYAKLQLGRKTGLHDQRCWTIS